MTINAPIKCTLRVNVVWNGAPNTVRVTFSANNKSIILTKNNPIKTIAGLEYDKVCNWTAKINNKNWKIPASGKRKMINKVETIAFILRKKVSKKKRK